MTHKLPQPLMRLVSHLKNLPGVGTRTAVRFAFEILKFKQEELDDFSQILATLPKEVPPCAECGCLTDLGQCPFCKERTSDALCIIASPKDAYAIEQTSTFQGFYHVIEHLLSPIDQRHAESIDIERIENRIKERGIREIILAFDSTLEGDATALYLKARLAQEGLFISRLAFGLPVGTSLEHIDGGTLARALSGRQSMQNQLHK